MGKALSNQIGSFLSPILETFPVNISSAAYLYVNPSGPCSFIIVIVGPNSTNGGSATNATGVITSTGRKWAQSRLLFAVPTTGKCKSTNSSIPATQTTETGDKSSALPDNMPVKSPENLDPNSELALTLLELKLSVKISTLQKALLSKTAILIVQWTFQKINKENSYLLWA
jgi:hypothetical protein